MPLGRAILLLAVPMVLEMSAHSVFSVCDAWFVSRLGSAAIASVGLSEALLSLVFAIGLGLAMGTAATVARRIGEKNPDGAAVVTAHAIVLGLGVSVVIGVIGALNARRLLLLMGAQQEVVEAGQGYATWLFGGSGTILMLILINAAFRGAGDPMLALKALAFANLVNIALDPILIFGWGPIPAFGVTGAALATNIGRGLGVLYQFQVLARGRGQVRIEARHLRFAKDVAVRLWRVSGVAMFQFAVATTSFTGLVRVLTPHSPEALAGYTIAVRMIIFVILPAWGLSNAAATLVGQNLGAGKPERAERSAWATARYNMAFLGAVSVFFLVAAPWLVRFFTDVDPVILYGTQCMRITALCYLPMAFGMVMVAAFNGSGDTTTPTWINLGCHWLFKIPLAWFLTWPLGWGPAGVFAAIPAAEILVATCAVLLFRRGRWKNKVV